ncbi:unnamed protein product [Rotaria sordida]|uniref:U2A'/phosphoprotein 32 family A C-terminal domain-containing protein n=1 Tax=Rotaria sordida TaxID=392033 RepID=A0A818K8N8_9BILA|nr:unnamed protein product [Rotaria sordida]CAF3615297.1 unnamed protein product [Rotaria sordida]
MGRLTPEVIEAAPQYLNPVGQYELSLRDLKIPVIENLGATLNQFDTIDFTNNDLRKLDGFPFLPKLKTLYLANNHIARIADNLQEYIANLDTLMLNNNMLQELSDIDPLATLPKLTHVSFARNPIAMKKDYRLYVIYMLPNLRTLDYNRITQKEREAARKLYKSKSAEKAKKKQKGANTFVPGGELAKQQQQAPRMTKKDADAIKKAILEAKSIEEVERLKAMLQAGQMPHSMEQKQHQNGHKPNSEAMEQEQYSVQSNEALQFLFRGRRSFLHPGKTKCEEQKREARKAYEEKCSLLGKRFCPKLSTWREFQQWEIGGGYESKRNPLPTQPPTPQMHTMRTHHTRLYTPATLRTHKTPMFGPVTMRQPYHTPPYTNEFVTRNPFED